jgi:hypothetical protein
VQRRIYIHSARCLRNAERLYARLVLLEEKVVTWPICPAKGVENAKIRHEKGFLGYFIVSFEEVFSFKFLCVFFRSLGAGENSSNGKFL